MKFILIALCLTSCAVVVRPPSYLSYEAVCYNGPTDCWAAAWQTCPSGFIVIDQSARSEGRAGDDAAVVRLTERYVCKGAK